MADDERPRVVVAVRMGRRRRRQREQEEEGGEEQAEGSHGPDHSTGCARSGYEVTGRSQTRLHDRAACAACSTPSSSPFSSAASARSWCSPPERNSPSAASPTRHATHGAALHGGKAKNVIFFLGDGMGDQEVTAARYYQYGAAGHLNLDRLPFTGFQTTWSVKPAAAPPYKPDYDPDSASTGTMWATGQKTIDERISQGPSSAIDVPGKNLPTVLERRAEAGQEGRQCDDRRAHRRDAGGARLAHLAAWLPGPGGLADSCARRRRRPRAASARSPSRPSTIKRGRGAGRRAQPLRADDHGRQGRRQDGGAVRRAPGLSRRSTTPPASRPRSVATGRCSACSLPST